MADKKSKKIDKQFKKAERKLYDYTGLKSDVECLEYELEMLEKEYEGCKAITYSSETTGITNNITDTVYEELIRREKDILDKTKKINKKKIQIKRVEAAMSLLDEKEKKIVEARYFSNDRRKNNWNHIAKMTGYCDRQCVNIRDGLIEKIKNRL